MLIKPRRVFGFFMNSHLTIDPSFNASFLSPLPAGCVSTPLFVENSVECGSSVVYVHEPTVALHHYGAGHPMKPYRLALTHDLVMNYGLESKMKVLRGRKATKADLMKFHSTDYVEFLGRLTSENTKLQVQKWGAQFNIGDDCPVFDGLYDFCCLSAGSSLLAASYLSTGLADIAINWSGGLHHAKRAEASGFCYINDIVLAILDLLRVFPRVLYIDIDIHHGDGVQEAFYVSDRVFTLSFHKHGDGFFPGSGDSSEIGVRKGTHFSLNIPLRDGIDDSGYAYIFQPIVSRVVSVFRPSVVVLQCGADSLGCDRLGCFNLSIQGHGACVSFVKKLGIPMLVLGGGGYTIRNVSRCWTYETSLLVDVHLSATLPKTPHIQYFSPDFKLFPDTLQKRIQNENTRPYLDSLISQSFEQLRNVQSAPSTQIQMVPVDDDEYSSDDSE